MSDQSVADALRSAAPLVVIEAPAGCGKTHQAAEYAHWLAPSMPSGKLLILTHTHAACDVFRARTASLRQRVCVTTIDGLVVEIARMYHRAIGLPTDVVEWAYENGPDGFENLATAVVQLMRNSSALVKTMVARFPVVICDEHQDSNAAQHALAMCLLEGGALLRIFGDPVQAIFGRRQQLAAYTHRWNELARAASHFDELNVAHRWNGGSESLGRWVLNARHILRDGGQIDLRGQLPAGLSMIIGNNIGPRRGTFALERFQGRAFNRCVDAADELLVLSGQTQTVRGINAYLGRRVRIWEGHTREALDNLVKACKEHIGAPTRLAEATAQFIQSTTKGFTAGGFATPFLTEVATGCANVRRGKPAQLQTMARALVNSPNHHGVAAALLLLRDLIENHVAFQSLEIDLRREYAEAIELGRYDEPSAGLSAIIQRRSSLSIALPQKCISTIHKAKGHQTSHAIIAPCDRAHFGDSVQKRNLLYVAISRASHTLTLHVPRDEPSPLLIPPA